MIEQTILQYRIIEKLGEGGMGIVYKAEDTRLNRIVALKFLPDRVNNDETAKARFFQEAQAAAGLNHPNICTVFGVEEFDGKLFMSMEYVEGGTLSTAIPFKKIDDAITIAAQIGDALQEAHAKGIVHRDIKADNIMLSSKGQAKVMDFGLAKLKGAMKLTRTSSTVGTLGYMAPEQIQGGEVDHRSDIFSFGVLLFEMLAGRLPFRGEHEAAMVYSIVNEEPQNIAQFVPDLSPIVVNLIHRCLEKDPAERYQHFDDITADLKRALRKTSKVMRSTPAMPQSAADQPAPSSQSSIVTVSPTAFLNSTAVRIGLAMAGASVVGLIAWIFFGTSQPKINPNMVTSVLQIPATEYQYPDISPDGKWLAFPGSDVKGNWDIYMMFIETGESRRLTSDSARDQGNAATARFSPDGSSITYGRMLAGKTTTEICVVSVLTGSSRVVADSALSPTWNAAGDRIYFYRNNSRSGRAPSQSGWREYWSVTPLGSDQKLEFIDSLADGALNYFTFRIAPDGERILFTRPMKGDYNEIFIRDMNTGKETQITDDKKIIDEAVLLENGMILYSSNRSGNFNIWAIPEDGGNAVQVTRGAGPDYGISYSHSANRLIFSQRTETSTLWMINTDGTDNRQVFPDENISRGQLSPDGKSIALQVLNPVLWDALMIRDLSGGRQEFIFPFDISVGRGEPVWSPSGDRLAFLEFQISGDAEKLTARVIDIAGGRRIQDFGEGVIDRWISDSVVLIVRNTSKDAKRPKYNESHLLNIRSGKETLSYKDTTYAFPLLGNSMIGYVDGENNIRIVTRQALEKHPAAAGDIVLKGSEIVWANASQSSIYFVTSNRSALWKIDPKTRIRTKVMNLAQGENVVFYRADESDKVLTYNKHRRKTSIVKIDNLFDQ